MFKHVFLAACAAAFIVISCPTDGFAYGGGYRGRGVSINVYRGGRGYYGGSGYYGNTYYGNSYYDGVPAYGYGVVPTYRYVPRYTRSHIYIR